ncbi:MAG: murein DD-endopeptidase MepM/ murein hydrolase activator NlpD [Gammaproteobacteria bacterium]|jgi:murein DD-endopeptidase MepM/ murein hydrolase activator NlpD
MRLGLILFTIFACSHLSACQSLYTTYGFGKVARSLIKDETKTSIVMPENAPSISQRYRPGGISSRSEHRGFDILVPTGTEVLAAANGVIKSTEVTFLYGRVIVLNHGIEPSGQRLQTRYFHLSEFKSIPGQIVERGDPIGLSGASGAAGLFPHLHFEVHRVMIKENFTSVHVLDPQAHWVEGPGKVSCFEPPALKYSDNSGLTYPVPCRVSTP